MTNTSMRSTAAEWSPAVQPNRTECSRASFHRGATRQLRVEWVIALLCSASSCRRTPSMEDRAGLRREEARTHSHGRCGLNSRAVAGLMTLQPRRRAKRPTWRTSTGPVSAPISKLIGASRHVRRHIIQYRYKQCKYTRVSGVNTE